MKKNNNIPLDILVVDDHQMFMDGLTILLKRMPNINKIFTALNGMDAMNIIKSTPIDLVITDIGMPEISGIELTQKIKAQFPHIKVLVLSMYNDKEIIKEIINAEAEGYILKNTGREELLNSINKIADGGTFYSKDVLEVIINNTSDIQNNEIELSAISQREKEIIQLICQEYTTNDIAKKLFISPYTVETHRKNILHKINVKTVVGLIKYAYKYKIISTSL